MTQTYITCMHTCGASYLLASYLVHSFMIRDSNYLLSCFSKDFVAHSTLALPEIANNHVLLACFSVRVVVVLWGLTHLTQLFSFLTLYMHDLSPSLWNFERNITNMYQLLNEIRSVWYSSITGSQQTHAAQGPWPQSRPLCRWTASLSASTIKRLLGVLWLTVRADVQQPPPQAVSWTRWMAALVTRP